MEPNKTFIDGLWSKEINVTSFVQTNITPYLGDASFLQGPTERTKHIWNLCLEALEEERRNNGIRSLDNKTVSTITSHKAGYIDREQELIVGLQTDELLKRAIKPFGGINVVSRACKENGTDVDEKVKDIFTHYRKTHNDGVFDVYTEEIRSFRSLGFLTGLPDNYARGRIIGDYRRLALYGTDRLIEAKQQDLRNLTGPMTEARIRLREEVAEQIKALKEIRTLGEYYGLDLSRPAHSAQEAVQWVYMAYLAAVKEQDGAAMSLGNVSSFLDIFIEYDLAHGLIDETFAQELIDQFVIKLRMVRHLRMQSYNDIFAGDPTWVTEAIRRPLQRRPDEGDEDLVPLPANALQPRSLARAQHDGALEPRAAAGLQGVLRQGVGRHQLDPVRERRADARGARLGRLRHRLLRVVSGHRPSDPVLRRPRQPGQRRCCWPSTAAAARTPAR